MHDLLSCPLPLSYWCHCRRVAELVPVVEQRSMILSSEKDAMLPSVKEGSRLAGLMQVRSQIVWAALLGLHYAFVLRCAFMLQ